MEYDEAQHHTKTKGNSQSRRKTIGFCYFVDVCKSGLNLFFYFNMSRSSSQILKDTKINYKELKFKILDNRKTSESPCSTLVVVSCV